MCLLIVTSSQSEEKYIYILFAFFRLKMDIIDFEAHFYTKDYAKTLLKNRNYPRYKPDKKRDVYWLSYTPLVQEPHTVGLLDKLVEVEEKRIKDMDQAGVKMQVLSLSAPGCEQFNPSTGVKLARKVNDELSAIVEKHSDRFVGLASLAPQDPTEAAEELRRAVKDLGLRGWKTHSNIRGRYLDDKRYWVILEEAEKLGVPIFLHPTVPRIRELGKDYAYALGGPAFGFTFDTALCMMRLILSGVFDKYPNLKFVLGHLGETLPFLLNRLDFPVLRPWVAQHFNIKLSKKPSEYLKTNVFVGTSGEFYTPALTFVIETLGCDKILFASDYPYEDSIKAVERIKVLSISEEDKIKIYYFNAKALLNIR